jgi:hypothetical protein
MKEPIPPTDNAPAPAAPPRADDPPIDPETGEPPRSDAGQGARVAPEHPKGRTAPLPPGHPSRGTIDEGGVHP